MECSTIQLNHCQPLSPGPLPSMECFLHGFTCPDLVDSRSTAGHFLDIFEKKDSDQTQSCSQEACSLGVGGMKQVGMGGGGGQAVESPRTWCY